MVVFPLTASLLIILAIVFLLGLSPERITEDIAKIISPKQSLRDKVKIAQGKKKPKNLANELNHIREAFSATGKGGQFATIGALSLALFISGGVFAVLIDNIFLVPIFSISFCNSSFIIVPLGVYKGSPPPT